MSDLSYIAILFLVVQIIIVFFSIVLHEIGHGYMAYKLGDPTAKNMGRLTLNPLKHIDPIGSLVFVVTLTLTMMDILPIPFGWAKPVMIDFRYFKNPRKAMALVAFSGPMMNLGLAALFTFAFKMMEWVPWMVPAEIGLLAIIAIFLNLFLAGINLLPIPPLDGSNIVAGFLPWKFTIYFHKFRFIGIAVLFILIFTMADNVLDNVFESFFKLFIPESAVE